MTEVTIIIPVLNEEKYLEKCITSLRQQTFPFNQMEIVIIDGGSIDKTIEIILNLCKTNSNIKLLQNPKKIQAEAFNIGVANTTSPYIIRLDAHVTYHKDYILYILEELKNKEYGNVGGKCKINPQKRTLIAESNAIINKMQFAIGGADFRVGSSRREVETVPFGGFRREVVEEIGGMNPKLPRGEDNEYNRRILDKGYKILFDPRIIATYYARPDLRSMLKQMYANGFSIGVLMHCYRSAVGIRHLIPVLFLLSIIGFLIGAIFFKWFLWLLLSELTVYFFCSIFFSIQEAKKYGWKYLSVLPWEVFLVHVSYGYGTLVGLIKRHY